MLPFKTFKIEQKQSYDYDSARKLKPFFETNKHETQIHRVKKRKKRKMDFLTKNVQEKQKIEIAKTNSEKKNKL